MITTYDTQTIANNGVRTLVAQELARQQRERADLEARKLARVRRENADLRARLSFGSERRREDYARRILATRRATRALQRQARQRHPVTDALWGLVGWLVLGREEVNRALLGAWRR